MAFHKESKRMEDQWSLENDARLLREIRRKREERIREEKKLETERKREELKAAHWMCCPKCGHRMETKDLEGIEIEICSLCEGIYLDRGELEDLFMKKNEQRRGLIRRILGLGDS